MITTLEEIAKFLLDHGDLISLLKTALESGVNKDDMVKTIKESMVAASDAVMEVELGLGSKLPSP
jgi:hypothetical protein